MKVQINAATAAAVTLSLAVAAHAEQRRYLRPEPEDDIPMHRLLSNDVVQQVNVRISDLVGDKWTYVIQYASESLSSANGCHATGVEENEGELVNGTAQEPTTYSILNDGGEYNNPADVYTSPYLHKCELLLDANARYEYHIDGLGETAGEVLTPPLPGDTNTSLKFAVMADVGQTNYSSKTMDQVADWLLKEDGTSILWPGDLSYADGYSPRWDSFGRLAQKLLSNVETIWGAGNHEYASGEAFVPYKARYGGEGSLWYSTKRGMAQIITLCSYCQGGVGSAQYNWLKSTLNDVNKTQTPWLIVQFHTPWYCSDETHVQEGEVQRAAMEPLFKEAGVDIVFAGHVHAYERTHAVYNYEVSECGTVHVTIGDGGNRERVANTWYQQPQWSAERESSFGFGTLHIVNETTAEWQWVRNPDGYYQFPGEDQQPFPVTPTNFAMNDTVVIDRSTCRN